jgi:hypothetical protein
MRFAVRTYHTAAVNNQTAGAPRVCVCNVCAEYELRHQPHIYPHTTQPATAHMTDQIESDDGHAAAVTPTHHRCWRCLRATQPHGRDALRANMGETLLNATHPIPAPKGLGQIRKQSTIGCFLSYVSTSCVCLHLIQPHPELSSAATCIRVQKWDGSATASAGLTLARHDRRA